MNEQTKGHPAEVTVLDAKLHRATDGASRQLMFSWQSMKRRLSGLVQKARQYKLHSQIKLLAKSQLFDKDWYIEQYPDVAGSGVDPLVHYLLSGAAEGRDPHPLFNTHWYLEKYPDVAGSGMNPLAHFLLKGAAAGYDPNPLFDTDWYLKQYPDVAGREINPLHHYLVTGAAQNNDPGPLFSTKGYIDRYPEVSRSAINPLASYLRHGTIWLEKRLTDRMGPTLRFDSTRASVPVKKLKLLFIGHDASSTGAPVLLLNIMRSLKESFNIEAAVILLTGGPLETDFAQLAPTYLVDKDYRVDKDYKRFKQLALQLWKQGYTSAMCNTAVTGKCAEILYQAGFMVLSVIHEMDSVIRALKVEDECRTIARYAHQVVFPANIVRSDFETFSGSLGTRAIINPQGLLKPPVEILGAKERVCDLLNISYDSILVLAAGVGDLRKGLDLYLQVARQIGLQDRRFHFIWVGNIAHDAEVWFKQDIDSELLRRCFHHIPFTAELSLYLQSANVFVLTSREDPFPSVVIDALAYGIPVIAFDKCGGYVDLLASKLNGKLVPYGDMQAMTGAIQRIATDKTMLTAEAKRERSKPIIEQFDFKHYTSNLLQLFDCTLPSN